MMLLTILMMTIILIATTHHRHRPRRPLCRLEVQYHPPPRRLRNRHPEDQK